MKEGIQTIIQKINMDAQQHSSEYYEQKKNNIDKEISSENIIYLNDFSKKREILMKNNELEYAHMLERVKSRLNHDILTYQHKLMDEIFYAAVKKLRNISKNEFLDMFKAAINKLSGNFILYLGELSKDMIDADEIKKAVKEKPERKTGLSIDLSDENIPGKSGFVFRDGRVEYNCLFEDLIEDKKNSRTAAILKEVFGEEEIRLEL